MRSIPVVGLSLLIAVLASSPSVAADKKKAPQPLPEGLSAYAPLPTGPGILSELRLGGSAQDPSGVESGSANLTGEVLFSKPFSPADLFTSYFVPRPHVGGSFNLDNKTNFAYVGALGCSPLFRESGSVGVKLSSNWRLMATVEHLSNGGACSDNRGLTNVGARVGYAF
jgi:lipid A 3-O-deacylase